MKKTFFHILFFVFLACGLFQLLFAAENSDKVIASGMLRYGIFPLLPRETVKNRTSDSNSDRNKYWLELDKQIVFAPGSKSERIVKNVSLELSTKLLDKTKNLVDRHVEVGGVRECIFLYSPWTATCKIIVEQISTP